MDALQLLGSLLGNNATASSNGNQILSQLVSSLTGGGAAAAGAPAVNVGGGANVGVLLGGLAMTALQAFSQRSTPNAQSPLSALMGMLGGGGGSAQSPLAALAGTLGLGGTAASGGGQTAHTEQQALALVQAMINAAKSDGQIDEQEKEKIVSRLSGLGPQEIEFVQQELGKPLNVDFLRSVAPSMATEVYTVSLMAINLDTQAEAQYMHNLAQQLGLNPQAVNNIHRQLGINPLFA